MTTLFFLFKWAFWQWFFIVMGIIFCLYIIAMLALIFGIDWFDEAAPKYGKHEIINHIHEFVIHDIHEYKLKPHRVKLLINYKNGVWTSRVLSGNTGWSDHTWDNKDGVVYTSLDHYIKKQVQYHTICYINKQNK